MEDLASSGATEAEVARYLEKSRQSRGAVTSSSLAYVEALTWLLSGEHTPWDAHWAETESLTPADLVAPAAQMRDSMLYAVPSGSELDGLPRAPMSSVEPELAGHPLTRTTETPSGVQMFASDEGIEVRTDSARATVRYATCRATLANNDGSRALIGPDGTYVMLRPREWVESVAVRHQVDLATAGVMVPMPDPAQPTSPPPAARVPRVQWLSRLTLGVVSLLGALVMVLAATDPTMPNDVKSTTFALAFLFLLLGMWLVRGVWRDRHRAVR